MRNLLVTIQTGARLHFGPLSYQPQSGRHFGGIGLMIDRPGVKITLSPCRNATPARCSSDRATRLDAAIQSRLPWKPEPVQLTVHHEIPSHCGLGSGTQLALALADARATLQGDDFSVEQLASFTGRGERSAIGLRGYELGGFLVDAGRRSESDVGALAVQVPFPSAWRILLVREREGQGLHGEFEVNAFQDLAPMTPEVSGQLCRLALTEILPALQTGDLTAFNAALYSYGELVGSFFAGPQKGIFSSSVIRELARQLPVRELGMAQSSWGPTVALFVPHDQAAHALAHDIETGPLGKKLRIDVVRARNEGRTVTQTEFSPETIPEESTDR